MKRRGQPKLEKKACKACGAGFRPAEPLSGVSTENYCSSICAWEAMKETARVEHREGAKHV